MMRLSDNQKKKRPGIALVTVLLLMPIMLFLLLFIGKVILNESGFARVEQTRGRAFYLAESAAAIAYQSYKDSAFERSTSSKRWNPGDSLTASPRSDSDPQLLLLADGLEGWTYDETTGWYTWEYKPGIDPRTKAYCGGTYPEMMRFRLAQYENARLNPDGSTGAPMREFQILAEGKFDRFARVHEITGRSEPLFQYALYSANDLSEFLRGPAQVIRGKVHANGNLYFKPGSSLLIMGALADKDYVLANGTVINEGDVFPGSHKVSTAAKIVNGKDAWDRTRGNNTDVQISKDGTQGNTANLNKVDGKWFGSDHAKWMHPTNGAADRYDSYVQDYQLGAIEVSPPATKAFSSAGYYATTADLKVDYTTSASWASQKTFRNAAEERDVPYVEVDVNALRASGNWPKNGTIYSDVPIVLINASNLVKPASYMDDPSVPNGLTIVSDSTIYTKGDFNMNYPTPAHLEKSTDTNFFGSFYASNDPNNVAAHPALYDPAAFKTAVDTYFASEIQNADQRAMVEQDPQYYQPPFMEDPDSPGNYIPNPASIYTPPEVGGVYQTTAYEPGYENRHSSALMTNDRIYHVSEGFGFTMAQYDKGGNYSGVPHADDKKRYKSDENQVVEINSAMVDGAVTVDERRFAQPLHDTGSAQGSSSYSGDQVWENSDDFLERFNGKTVRKRGAIIHMQNANMAKNASGNPDWSNSSANVDVSAGITPWIINTSYQPPNRDYGYDPQLLVEAPPNTPYSGTKEVWRHHYSAGISGFGAL